MKTKKQQKNTEASVPDFPPGFVNEAFTIPGDADMDQAFYHARIKPLIDNPDYLRALADLPSKDQVVAEWMKKSDAEVVDEDFFEAIKWDPRLLGSRFAQEKITRWQDEMHGFRIEDLPDGTWRKVGANEIEAFRAKENLKKIGTTLAEDATERPRTDHQVYAVFKDIHEIIKQSGISQMRQKANRSLRLKEITSKEIAEQIKTIPSTDREIAIAVTAVVTGHTPSTVRTYLKKKRYKEIMLGDIPAVQFDPSK